MNLGEEAGKEEVTRKNPGSQSRRFFSILPPRALNKKSNGGSSQIFYIEGPGRKSEQEKVRGREEVEREGRKAGRVLGL